MRRPHHFLALAASLATSTALTHPSHLFDRQSASACASSYTFCAGSGFPSSFCCPATSTCITLASNTTLLCCGSGMNCQSIEPIICDIAQQNATVFPVALLKSTNLSAALVTCGTGCCPFGFSCNSNKCVMDADQKLLPPAVASSSAPPKTTSPATSTIPVASPSSSSPAHTALPNITTSPPSTCASFPAGAVLAGFFPGLIAGVLLSLLTLCLLGARRRKVPKISSPSLQGPGSGFRTDFVRRYQPSPAAQNETAQMVAPGTPMQRMRSLFRKSSASSAPRGLGMGLGLPPAPAPQRPLVSGAAAIPVTPRLQREPSSESINIFADPSTTGSESGRMSTRGRATSGDAGGDRQMDRDSKYTTFTEMMERADLGGVRRGEPYVLPREEMLRLTPNTYAPRPGDGSPRVRGRG